MKKGEMIKKILLTTPKAAAIGGMILVASTASSSPVALRDFINWYQKHNRQGKYRVRKTFEQLRRERLIEMTENEDGNTKIILTENGKKKVLKYQFEDLKIKPMDKWDKKWRMVIFDIPESQKNARNALRDKLRELNFHQLQKSVWLHPYQCKDEINFIVEFFNISPYVRTAEVNNFDGDKLVKEDFGI